MKPKARRVAPSDPRRPQGGELMDENQTTVGKFLREIVSVHIEEDVKAITKICRKNIPHIEQIIKRDGLASWEGAVYTAYRNIAAEKVRDLAREIGEQRRRRGL